MHHFEGDAFVHSAAQQQREMREEVGRVEHFALEGLLARIGEQAAHQIGGAHGRFVDRLEIVIGRITERMAALEELAIALSDLQHVVDLVRDAAGNVADGLHLFAVREALLQQPVLGDVHDIGDRRAAGCVERHEDVDVLDLVFADRAGELQRHRLVDRLHEGFGGALGAVFIKIEQVGETRTGRCAPAAEFHQGAVGVEDDRAVDPVAVEAHGAEGRIVEHRVAVGPHRTRGALQGKAVAFPVEDLRARQQDRAAIGVGAAA